jgi:hypothetical protein
MTENNDLGTGTNDADLVPADKTTPEPTPEVVLEESKTIIIACLDCNEYPCTCGAHNYLGECADCHKLDCDCGSDAYRETCPTCGHDLETHPMTPDFKLSPEACHLAVLPIPEGFGEDDDRDDGPEDTEDH